MGMEMGGLVDCSFFKRVRMQSAELVAVVGPGTCVIETYFLSETDMAGGVEMELEF